MLRRETKISRGMRERRCVFLLKGFPGPRVSSVRETVRRLADPGCPRRKSQSRFLTHYQSAGILKRNELGRSRTTRSGAKTKPASPSRPSFDWRGHYGRGGPHNFVVWVAKRQEAHGAGIELAKIIYCCKNLLCLRHPDSKLSGPPSSRAPCAVSAQRPRGEGPNSFRHSGKDPRLHVFRLSYAGVRLSWVPGCSTGHGSVRPCGHGNTFSESKISHAMRS